LKVSKLNPRLYVCCVLLGTCASLLSDMVSPDGKWVAYTIPAFDDDADLDSEIFLKSTDETPPWSLGKVAGELDPVTWIPESMLVPRVEWTTKEPKPGDDFFADQKQEQDLEGYRQYLHYTQHQPPVAVAELWRAGDCE
jgi:hypothetical protein